MRVNDGRIRLCLYSQPYRSYTHSDSHLSASQPHGYVDTTCYSYHSPYDYTYSNSFVGANGENPAYYRGGH